MSSDLIGRRRASEQRLDRARSLELALKEKTDILAATLGVPIEQLDFDGSFRAALTALGALAARRTHFDVIVTLPDAPFAMRIQHINDAVNAEVLLLQDGPFEPAAASANPAASHPQSPAAETSPAAYVATGVTEPTRTQSPQRQASYAQPSHSQPPYPDLPFRQPSYSESSHPQPAYGQAALGQVAYAEPQHPTSYATSAPTTWPPAPPAPPPSAGPPSTVARRDYTVPPRNYSESSGSSGPSRPTGVAEPSAMVHVASDLAELLWQGVDDMPS